MTLIYIFLLTLAILLIVSVIQTLKTGKKEESNELIEIKISEATVIQNLKDTSSNLKINL